MMPHRKAEMSRDEYLKLKKEYYQNNKHQWINYRIKTKERRAAWKKEYSEKNKDLLREKDKKRYLKERDRRIKNAALWALKNPQRRTEIIARYHTQRVKRMPKWLAEKDIEKIKSIYARAKNKSIKTGESWHVDHIIPLKGKCVSGLHVPSNLRVVKAKTNLSKNNYFDIDREWSLQT